MNRFIVQIGLEDADLRTFDGRAKALRWVAADISVPHDPAPLTHNIRLDPRALRLVLGPHRFGGTAVRLDGFCLDCKVWEGPLLVPRTFTATYVHQEDLLPYVDGWYLFADKIGGIPRGLRRTLADGSLWVEAEAIRLVVLARMSVK